jgi:hypothetical protein
MGDEGIQEDVKIHCFFHCHPSGNEGFEAHKLTNVYGSSNEAYRDRLKPGDGRGFRVFAEAKNEMKRHAMLSDQGASRPWG